MSHHQSRAERGDSQQQRRSARSGAGAHHRAAGKGGGVGGHGPSAGATPLLSPTVQPAHVPSSKRSNGNFGQPRVSSFETPDSQRSQQSSSSTHQGQQAGNALSGTTRSSTLSSNGNVSRSSRPSTPSSSSAGSTEVASVIPKPESSWNAGPTPGAFQFGTLGAAYVQIPARTSSAPPNLDEQKQDLLRFETVTMPSLKVPGPSGGQQQGSRSQVQQSGGGKQQGFRPQPQQSTVVSAGMPPSSPYPQNQDQQRKLPAPVPQHPLLTAQPPSQMQASPVVSAQAHLQMQTHFIPPQSQQQGLVQRPYSQHTLQSQQGLMQHSGAQVLKYPQPLAGSAMGGQLVGPPLTSLPGPMPGPQITQVPHQLPGGLASTMASGMTGVSYGVVPTYIPPRTSSAVKIVHPETHEELKFDYKTPKPDDNARMMGNGPRGYAGGAHLPMNQNIYPQQNGPYTATLPHYHQPPPTIGISAAVTATKPSVAEVSVSSDGIRASKAAPLKPPASTASSSMDIASVTAVPQSAGGVTSVPQIAAEEKSVTVIEVHEKTQSDESAGEVSALDGSTAPSKVTLSMQDPAKQDVARIKDAPKTDASAASTSDVKQNNKKKKKKDSASKLSKAPETKKQAEVKVSDPQSAKAGTPKSLEKVEMNAVERVVPEAVDVRMDSFSLKPNMESPVVDDGQSSPASPANDGDETMASAVPLDVAASGVGVEPVVNSVHRRLNDTQQLSTSEEVVENQGDTVTVEAESIEVQQSSEGDVSPVSLTPDNIVDTVIPRPLPKSEAETLAETRQGILGTECCDATEVAAVDTSLKTTAGIAESLASNGPSKVVDGPEDQVDLVDLGSSINTEPSVCPPSKEQFVEDTTVVPAVDLRHGSKKKKMKDVLAKADAAGTTADLYNAYKPPVEKKVEEVFPLKAGDAKAPTDESLKQLPVTAEETKALKEPDDWEDAVELPAPKASSSLDGSEASKLGERHTSDVKAGETYTRDFLLTFKEQNMELPLDFDVRPDIVELLLNPEAAFGRYADRDVPGRILDRQLSGARRSNISSNFDDERWARQLPGLHSPGWQDPYGDMGGFRAGNAQGLIHRMPPNVRPGTAVPPVLPSFIPGRPVTPGANPALYGLNSVDSDRWQKIPTAQKGLIPSPQTSLPPVHKADKRYEIGKVSDEEEQKQRQVKGILNKLTPQNFQKLFEKVKEVNIQSAITLTGVISQIFDKALTEPTFCEMYATFCKQLATDMPEFVEDGEKVTFKRVLLNKCQEEFNRGEREQAEASASEVEGEDKPSPEEREEKRLIAKRRMLGNIRFIGELYKKHMLTERIMHECICKLLGGFENPEEEDIEALCKLMSTIGRMIDHPKVKDHIDTYMDRMGRLSNNQKLSSRIRFMLKDVIDLRRNGWQERRKVEGPKKIEEVHRDAVQERQATVAQAGRLSRGPSIGTSSGRRLVPPLELNARGPPSSMCSPATPMGSTPGSRGSQPQTGLRNSYIQDVRMEDRLLLDSKSQPMPLSQRPMDEGPIMLGPQGGLGRGMSARGPPSASSRVDMGADNRRFGPASLPAYSTVSGERPLTPPEKPLLDRLGSVSYSRSTRHLERTLSDRAVSSSSVQQQQHGPNSRPSTAPSFLSLNEEQLTEKGQAALLEYFSSHDHKEAAQCVEELRAPKFYPTMVYLWIGLSLEKKSLERELLTKLLINLHKSEPVLLKQEQIFQGFQMVMESFEDVAIDTPKAPEYLAEMLVSLVSAATLTFEDVGRLLKSDELLQSGFALDMIGKVLLGIRQDMGERALGEIFRSSGIRLEDYVIPSNLGSKIVSDFLQKYNLQCLGMDSDIGTPLGIHQIGAQLLDHLGSNELVSETLKWLERSTPALMQSDSKFLQMLMNQILKHSIPMSLEKDQISKAVEERLPHYKPLLKRFGTDKEKQRQYIVAMQLYVHEMGHPAGLMTALFNTLYEEEVISESAYYRWEDDVNDPSMGRDKALREVYKWLQWLKIAPEQSQEDDF